MNIIGIHNGHDSGISILENGKLTYHWELERYLNRAKHFSGLYNGNVVIEYLRTVVLPTLGWRGKDIDAICLSGLYYGNNPGMWDNTEFAPIINKRQYVHDMQMPYIQWQDKWDGGKIHFFASTHHINHMAYAYYTCPFSDPCLIFAYDGCGDFNTTTTAGIGQDNALRYYCNLTHEPPHNLTMNHIGYMFGRLNEVLGFFANTDSMDIPGKAMGLSAYGKPREEWKQPIADALRHHEKIGTLAKRFGIPKNASSQSELAQDFMATVQEVCEEYVLNVVGTLLHETKLTNLCVSGGCALNVQINSKLRTLTDNLYIPPACSDVGQSIGSCLYYWHHILKQPFTPVLWHNPYLGQHIANCESWDDHKRKFPMLTSHTFENDNEMTEFAAEQLQNGKIVGWAQGRCEIGPRALGNRSILASPCFPNMQHEINQKVKHREWWRPFAPVCLAEDAPNWFDTCVDHPHMLEAVPVKPERASQIPAVVHADGTARLQTVRKYQNPLLYRLIESFKARTGVPMLINTSLNDKGRPIAQNLDSILRLLNDTSLDYALVGNKLFRKIKIL